jgi:hypothetical protein
MLKNTAAILVLLLNASLAMAQTTAAKRSTEGVWELDLTQSKSSSDVPPPKSATLTILKDTPDAMAWRYDQVDATGKSLTFAWSGPLDGSLQDVKDGNGQVAGKASMKRDGDVMIRHTEDPSGTSDARGTVSADGNTYTDVETTKSKDGKTETTTTVYHRVSGGKPRSK